MSLRLTSELVSAKTLFNAFNVVSSCSTSHASQRMLMLTTQSAWRNHVLMRFSSGLLCHSNRNSVFFLVFLWITWLPNDFILVHKPLAVLLRAATESAMQARNCNIFFVISNCNAISCYYSIPLEANYLIFGWFFTVLPRIKPLWPTIFEILFCVYAYLFWNHNSETVCFHLCIKKISKKMN